MLVEEDPNFERRLDEVTAGLKSYIKTHLLERISRENAVTIVNYIQAFKAETNLADNYRESTIVTLKLLSEFPNRPVNEQKPFKAMTRDDILAFLNRLRKSNDVDPLHHWIGTYGNNVITINRFFKWLFYPLLKPSDRPRPEAIINVDKLDRKERL